MKSGDLEASIRLWLLGNGTKFFVSGWAHSGNLTRALCIFLLRPMNEYTNTGIPHTGGCVVCYSSCSTLSVETNNAI